MCIADVMFSGFSLNFTQAIFLMVVLELITDQCTSLLLHLVDSIDSLE